MAHLNLARALSGAALALAIGLAAAPTAQAASTAARPAPGTQAAGPLGPLGLDNLLSLGFLTPTVQDAKRQVVGLVAGLSPAPTSSTALGGLLK